MPFRCRSQPKPLKKWLRFEMRLILTAVCLWTVQETSEALWGSWQWVRSSGGMLGMVRVPESGTIQTLTFTRDHVAIFATHDSTTFSGNYHVYSDKTVFSATPRPVVRIQGTQRVQIIQSVTADSLILREDAFDGWERVYVRVR